MRALSSPLMVALLSACGGPLSSLDDSFFIRSRGADMPVLVRGDLSSSNVMLVFIAGGPGGPGIYFADTPAFVRLSKKFGIAFWDQRLSGSSTGTAGVETLTLDQYVTDLDALVQVLKLRHHDPKIVLLGWSWGGLVGTAYLSESARQQGVIGWIDVDGVHNASGAWALSRTWVMAAAGEQVAQGKDVAKWNGELAWYDAHPIVELSDMDHHVANVRALGGSERHPENDPGLGSAWMNFSGPFNGLLTLSNQTAVGKEAGRDGSAMNTALRTDLTWALPSVKVPSLVLWGEHDGQLPLPHGQEAYLALGTSDARKSMVVLHDAAHASPIDEPDGFAAAIEGFADGL